LGGCRRRAVTAKQKIGSEAFDSRWLGTLGSLTDALAGIRNEVGRLGLGSTGSFAA